MSNKIIADGLYEELLTESLIEQLVGRIHETQDIDSQEVSNEMLTSFFSSRLLEKFNELKYEEKVTLVNSLLGHLDSPDNIPPTSKAVQLRSVYSAATSDMSTNRKRPVTPLREMALLTNAKGEPSMSAELSAELVSADGVDIIMSFVKHSGLNLISHELQKLKLRGIPVRLITTVYMGATDKSALDILTRELGVQVKIDLEAKSTRLHAKAWLIRRNSGYTTAYVGSSNMSLAALTTGAEWNVRLSQPQSPVLLEKFAVAFETYWESAEFITYDPNENGELIAEALERANPELAPEQWSMLSGIEVRPHDYQLEMLEDLRVAREVHNFHNNLVVAATGTGKTVLSALDYKNEYERQKEYPSLLFIAHRKEILQQARATFQQVLGVPGFGELLVDGHVPKQWKFVFASVQSMSDGRISQLKADQFAHIIVDEFHRAEAPSYKKIFNYFTPKELVALTATPERNDGLDKVQREVFGGRIASELRLWDALDRELLTPFHYFGIGEDVNYKSVAWVNGHYDATQLSNLVTGNDARNAKIWNELIRKISKPQNIKCLAFCVSVEHAESMAEFFTGKGLKAVSVTGTTPSNVREKALGDLRSGEIQVITAVDVFNEGVDIRELDTILMLRPTESPVIFLQQLGRGLRKAKNKDSCLVLDFVGSHRAEYRLDMKYKALSGQTRGEIVRNLEQGFPFLPSGTSIQLDDLASEKVLETIKAQVAPPRKQLVSEIRSYELTDLGEFLAAAGRDLYEIYRHDSWTVLLGEAGLLDGAEIDEVELSLLGKLTRFLHVDDAARVSGYKRLVTETLEPWTEVDEYEKRLRSMLFWNIFDAGKDESGEIWASVDAGLGSLYSSHRFTKEFVQLLEVLYMRIRTAGYPVAFRNFESPLLAHATYSRYELVGAIGWARLPEGSLHSAGKSRTPAVALEGVFWVEEDQLDMFLVTLEKGQGFSPSTRFHDYAITPSKFRWESQNRTSQESSVGRRYLRSKIDGTDILIAVREHSSVGGFTQHFKLLGLADFIQASGSKPIKIDWELRVPMDPQTFKVAAAVKTA